MTNQDQTSKPTANEIIGSLTGYDEEKIEARFGLPPVGSEGVPSLRGFKFLRALIFANGMHAGLEEDKAYDAAMKIPVLKLDDEFADEEEEGLPGMGELPVTEQGKDSPEPV